MGTVSKSAMNHYRLISETWKEAALPPPTGLEAIEGAKLLWRMTVGGDVGPIELTSGNRHTWRRNGKLVLNPDRRGGHGGGWAEIVHDLSHDAHNQINRKGGAWPKPHNFDQAKLERKMQRIVLDRLVK